MTSCHVWLAVNTNELLKKLNPDFFMILCELNWDITVQANSTVILRLDYQGSLFALKLNTNFFEVHKKRSHQKYHVLQPIYRRIVPFRAKSAYLSPYVHVS